MSYLYPFLVFLGAFFFQVSFFGSLKLFSFVPNFVLITTVFFGFRRDLGKTLPIVLVFGFLLDLLFSRFFGFHLIFLTTLLFLINFISKEGKAVSLVRILFFVFLGSIFYSSFLLVGLYFDEVVFTLRTFTYLGARVVIDMIFALFLSGFFNRYFKFLERNEEYLKQRIKL